MKLANIIFVLFSLGFIFYSCKRSRAYEILLDGESLSDEEVVTIGVPQKLHNVSDSLLFVSAPSLHKAQLLYRIAYIASYNNGTRCPNWVSWMLTRNHTDGPYPRRGVPYYSDDGTVYGIGKVTSEKCRNGYFVDSESEEPRQLLSDWTGEYNMSHGHMCPAGDNKWDKAAMNQSFLLTNMCPQDAALNNGSWKKLEEKCRTWAKQYGKLSIVAGPIFYSPPSRFLGHIAIPDAFFKVILRHSDNLKAIGFIYENNSKSQSMNSTYCTVNFVEEVTGYDFFSEVDDEIEEYIESECNINDWK